mmetsp:Transcript_26254/g.34138  ORF Transcript_26254/g.34138 Transcript_26254/m.34138 type:complete len:223 (+) Transcript_26254:189-857(+)
MIFNADKFRFHSYAYQQTESPKLSFEIGLTNYRDYIGTHLQEPNEHQELIERGLSEGNALKYFSCALGCEAVLSTSDDFIILLRRTSHVATHAGLFNGPSGHPEPHHLFKGPNQTISSNISSSDERTSNSSFWTKYENVSSGLVVNELFSSVIDEVVSETGLNTTDLNMPLLIGAMKDSGGKPDLLFLVSTNLTAEQARKRPLSIVLLFSFFLLSFRFDMWL